MSAGWPDPANPGVPKNPTADGWHWLGGPQSGNVTPRFWQAKRQAWDMLAGEGWCKAATIAHWHYHGPCLTPSDIDARVAAARLAEREAAAKLHSDASSRFADGGDAMMARYEESWSYAILAQPAPDGADALAAQIATAVADMKARKDAAYLERNRLVALLASLYPSVRTRTAIPGWGAEWHGCVYIMLPNGQASWHYHDSHAFLFVDVPEGEVVYDGHTTEQKYARIEALAGERLRMRRRAQSRARR